MPSTPAIAKARARLGAEPLRRLFVEVARPLATSTPGAPGIGAGGCWRWTGRPWMWPTPLPMPRRLDGRRPIGASGPPSRRSAWVAVAECGTHAIIQATMGPLAKGETTLAAELFGPGGVLGQGVLLLADRQFVDANLWRQAATGAQLL